MIQKRTFFLSPFKKGSDSNLGLQYKRSLCMFLFNKYYVNNGKQYISPVAHLLLLIGTKNPHRLQLKEKVTTDVR
jgi:hypothetical protein